ncbi:MAG TPA: ABC transporter permease [Gemmataceae bacterium]|nr:ABC transporter permease [Gemmataceae bacterium]
MSSKAVSERSEQESAPGGRRPNRETAPSVIKADDPTLARWLAFVGLMLATLGLVALVAWTRYGASRISPFWGSLFVISGLALLLFHAAVDSDVQIRRVYGVFGYALAAVAILFAVIPFGERPAGALFVPWGLVSLVMALLFLLPFARNETEGRWHQTVLMVIGVVGLALAAVGFIGGSISETFLLGGTAAIPYGLLLIVLGLAYLWAYLGLEGTNSAIGYRAGMAIGAAGALVFLIAFGRSVVPPLFHWLGWLRTNPQPYFVPTGLVLVTCGFLYAALAIGLFSESRFIVLFRRELSAFFYSPIAYIVLFGFLVVSWVLFAMFVADLEKPFGEPTPEPIISNYLLNFFPIICLIFAVPVLTMRLLSEEHRTGTFEVLVTAPVGETLVVLSKFLAALTFYMLIWLPWGLCAIALRVEGQQPFEYRPLLIFYLMQLCTGAGFVSMGLFFSSLTRNQIVSAILTFMGMLLLTLPYWIIKIVQSGGAGASSWAPFVTHISYINLWVNSIYFGQITPKFYVFFISAAVFWLFLSVKVLESRHWR